MEQVEPMWIIQIKKHVCVIVYVIAISLLLLLSIIITTNRSQ